MHDVQGDGIALKQLTPTAPDSIIRCTVALAGNNGIALLADSAAVAGPSLLLKNISVMNGRVGIAPHGLSNGTTAQNDCWRNGLADFTNISIPDAESA
ncbi:MAG: hypothetical protein IPJ04_00540 [Candidatus Eisenbacteria bacterium]|nr:hypothetical protein [Candidatus Eisenbacteria bacterium]